MSPTNRNSKVPNTGRLQAHDEDGAASHGVANMFLDDYSQNDLALHPLAQAQNLQTGRRYPSKIRNALNPGVAAAQRYSSLRQKQKGNLVGLDSSVNSDFNVSADYQ